MDIVKFKITPKTIKIEVRNTNNYVFDFNKAIEISKEDRNALLILYNALNLLFKDIDIEVAKNPYIFNQITIFDQIEKIDQIEDSSSKMI